jgi:hypothetical protein
MMSAAQKNKGPRGDITCKQQPLRSKEMAWSSNNNKRAISPTLITLMAG